MKVYIGPYHKDRIAPIKGWFLERDFRRNEVILKILDSVQSFFYNRFKRKKRVVIHDYDLWDADHTISIIVAPILRKLRDQKVGAPYVDDQDVPEKLAGDEHHNEKWDWVLNEMIWTFNEKESYNKNEPDIVRDTEKWREYQNRISNGFKLFGKYYQGLWT